MFAMLFGEVPVENLKKVSSKLWNAPVDLNDSWTHFVYVVGTFEDYHIVSVGEVFILILFEFTFKTLVECSKF